MTATPPAGENPAPLQRPGLTTKEICQKTGMTLNTLRGAIRRGELPALKFGHLYVVPNEAVAKFFPNVNF